MSLINEALKKAQRQRSLDNAPLSAAPSGVAAAAVTTHVRAASHKRSLAPLWFGLGLVALGVGATVLVMRYGIDPEPSVVPAAGKTATLVHVSPPPPIARPEAIASSPAGGPAAPAAPMVVLPPIPSTPSAASVTPGVSAAVAVQIAPPAPSSPPTPSTVPAAPAPVVPVAAPTPVAVAPVPAELTPAEREAKIYAFISGLRLAGVRGVDREARVLMNERVWRLNDTVAPELGLRLSAVRPNLLVFTDPQGKTYERPY